jgi:ribonuclease J
MEPRGADQVTLTYMIKLAPLGGLGEIGLNCLSIESENEGLLIDCGLMFPKGDFPGVDVVIPDFSHLMNNPEKLKGIVLTHAHEDHLGALPWLLKNLNVPVYGTRFTLKVAAHKLEEAQVKANLVEIAPTEKRKVGSAFSIEAIRVTHSVPDAVGISVKTKNEHLIHTGDFKLDGFPIDGHLTDLNRLGELGDEGVDVLLSDSTNSEVPHEAGSEQLVKQTFERLFSQAKKAIVVAMFGSHLHRVTASIELAQKFNRKVLLLGRSLNRNVELASQCGYFQNTRGTLVSFDEASQMPKEKLLVLCTGAQAEVKSGLAGLLAPDASRLVISEGDTVILSARAIPGNEADVAMLMNRILAKGAILFHTGNEEHVHVSGHAGQPEQIKMIQTVRPKNFIPIHGELRHLQAHSKIAESLGFDASRRFILRDGDELGFHNGAVASRSLIQVGQQLMRRESHVAIPMETIVERRNMAQGLVIAMVLLSKLGESVLQLKLMGKGLTPEENAVVSLAGDNARHELGGVSVSVRVDDERVREIVAQAVRSTFKQTLGIKPSVTVVVVRA